MKLENFHKPEKENRTMREWIKWLAVVVLYAALGLCVAKLAEMGRLIDWLLAMACGELLFRVVKRICGING